MLDLDAPILPGEGAAGLRVGSRLADLPPGTLAGFCVERRVNSCLPNAVLTIYRSPSVNLWVENRVIDQIEVHGAYRGKLAGSVGVGATIAEVEERVGPVVEDDGDGLCIAGRPGVCFEVSGACEGSVAARGGPIVRPLSITAIAVFRT